MQCIEALKKTGEKHYSSREKGIICTVVLEEAGMCRLARGVNQSLLTQMNAVEDADSEDAWLFRNVLGEVEQDCG